MPNISISYRRLDSQDITGRIFDRLAQRFGRERVFRDIDNIRPGIDFRAQIAAALEKTQVLLVIVGPKWLGRTKGTESRIDNEADPVRVEVELALNRNIPIIPVLVGGAKMPSTQQLPGSMTDFAFRHAVIVDSGRDFDHHLAGLIKALDQILVLDPKDAIVAPEVAADAQKSPREIGWDGFLSPLRRRQALLAGAVGLVVLAVAVAALRPWTWVTRERDAIAFNAPAAPPAQPAPAASPAAPVVTTPAAQPPANSPATEPPARPANASRTIAQPPDKPAAKSDLGGVNTIKLALLVPTKSSFSDSYVSKSKAAIELGLDLINNPRPELAGFPFGTAGGLPNFDGAKLAVVTGGVDTTTMRLRRGAPVSGAADDLLRRLIDQEHVVAIAGDLAGSSTNVSRMFTDQTGVPYVSPVSTASGPLSGDVGRVFRINPSDAEIARSFVRFVAELRKSGRNMKSIGILCEDCTFFQNEVKAVLEEATLADISIAINVNYKSVSSGFSPDPFPGTNDARESSDASDLARQFKAANPDVVIFLGHTIQFAQFIRLFKNVDYRPRIVFIDGATPSVPTDIFLRDAASVAQGVLMAGVLDAGRAGSIAQKINRMFREKVGSDLDDASARSLQALFVLADAINRAGSTRPEDIRKALQETDLKADQIIVGYQGIKFNSSSYNSLASSFLSQLQGASFVPVWPPPAARASFVYPFKGEQAIVPSADRVVAAPGGPLDSPADTSASPTDLAGTTWKGTDSTRKSITIVFGPGNVVNIGRSQGTWSQSGDTVHMEVNNRYAEYEGTIRGTRMQGRASNINKFSWSWSVEKQ